MSVHRISSNLKKNQPFIEIEFIDHKVHWFQVHNSIAWSESTELGSHYCGATAHFHQKQTSWPLAVTPPHPAPPPPYTIDLSFSMALALPILPILYGWNPTHTDVAFYDWLL